VLQADDTCLHLGYNSAVVSRGGLIYLLTMSTVNFQLEYIQYLIRTHVPGYKDHTIRRCSNMYTCRGRSGHYCSRKYPCRQQYVADGLGNSMSLDEYVKLAFAFRAKYWEELDEEMERLSLDREQESLD
jgi:hypothetical protein